MIILESNIYMILIINYIFYKKYIFTSHMLHHKLNINYGYSEKGKLIYPLSTGYQKAREAVAEYSSNEFVKVDPMVRYTRAYTEYR